MAGNTKNVALAFGLRRCNSRQILHETGDQVAPGSSQIAIIATGRVLAMRFPVMAVLLAVACVCAQIVPELSPNARPPAAVASPQSHIRVDTNVVLVPVTVTDSLNHFVEGLRQEVFEIYEDKVKQKIVSFGSDDAPLSIGIVFDTSGSMGAKLQRSRLSVAEFFKTTNPEDEAFLVEFSDKPRVSVPFTHNLDEIQNRLVFVESKGETALLDSVYLALATMRRAHNPRKALILITDGGDNNSRYTQAEVMNLVKEADVQIYAIGTYRSGRSREELAGPELLHDLTAPTGGRYFLFGNASEIPDIAAKIGGALRNEYVIGYTPDNSARDGKYRKISVKLVPPRGSPTLHAFWRTGYFAPTQ
jgi:Ca-activated chloride channel homolog